MHETRTLRTSGPDDPHAYDGIPEAPRPGARDARCPTCHGHGEWNIEIDLVSFRGLRQICAHCDGSGWIETGSDLIAAPDIVMTLAGYPSWVLKYRKPDPI